MNLLAMQKTVLLCRISICGESYSPMSCQKFYGDRHINLLFECPWKYIRWHRMHAVKIDLWDIGLDWTAQNLLKWEKENI